MVNRNGEDRSNRTKNGNQHVFIDARLIAYRRGGISRYVAELCRWLPSVAPGMSFSYVVNRATEGLSSNRVRVFTPPHFRFERETLGFELSLRRPDLVHSPDFIAPSTVGTKRVITVHDLSFLAYPEHLSRDSLRYYRQIERSLAVADRVITVSAYTADHLAVLTRVDPAKVVTIWNGVSHSRFVSSQEDARETIRQRLDNVTAAAILSDRPIILAVGTIEPRKRHQLLLRALHEPELRDDSMSPLLVIVGQRGWSCEEIVAEIRLASAAGHVVWLDTVDDGLLDALYRLATVLSMPSLEEGFGLPMLEAMKKGLPVVAAKRGALPEIAGDAATLVDDDDPEAWALALAEMISNVDDRERMREAGSRRATEFSWEHTALRTARVYQEVLSR